MSILHDKFTNLKDLNDLQPLVSETEDGESTTIEFKSITEKLKKSNLGEPKALLAKEICAFLNSNDGILVWGAEKSEDGRVTIVNESGMNLEDTFDHQLGNLVEPLPSGIEFKTIKDDADNECLVIFVPRSDLAPHRVGDWKMDDKKRILGRYYGRSGTSSVPLPENIVRAMYLSRGRIPKISIYTEVNIINVNEIQLKTIVEPDLQQYISQYHNSNQIAIIDSHLSVLSSYDDNSLWWEINDSATVSNNPICPKDTTYELLSSSIRKDDLRWRVDKYGYPIIDLSPIPTDDDIHFSPDRFSQIYAIATKSSFSCNNVPLTTRTRLYILDIPEHWHLNGYDLARTTALTDIEKKFNVEIYVAATLRKYIHDDGELYFGAFDGNLHTSHIETLLETLINCSHDETS